MDAKAPESPLVYELKITLAHVKPAIWRTIAVSDHISLDRLHDVIQIAMGWQDKHLHRFTIDGQSFSEDPEEEWEGEDEGARRLGDVVRDEGVEFEYEYDMGDGWVHLVRVEQIISPPRDLDLSPACLDGKRCCPPEDCGGPPGYENLVAAMKDKKHPERKGLIEWLGGEFDPSAFDARAVNVELAKYGRWSRARML